MAHLKSAISEGQLLAHPAANAPRHNPLAAKEFMRWRPTMYQAPPAQQMPSYHIIYRATDPLQKRTLGTPMLQQQSARRLKSSKSSQLQPLRARAPKVELNSPRPMTKGKPGFLDIYFDAPQSKDIPLMRRSATVDSLRDGLSSASSLHSLTPLGDLKQEFVASREMLWFRSSWSTHGLPTTEAMKEKPAGPTWGGIPLKIPSSEHLGENWASSKLPQRPGSIAAELATLSGRK